MSVILEILEKLMQEVRHGDASPLPLSLPRHWLSLSQVAIDRFQSRDQYLDYRCYAATLVHLNGKQTGSVLRVEDGSVYDRWLWQQKWTR